MTKPPLTGPEAIQYALQNLDLGALEKEQRDVIHQRKKTARPRAVRLLRILDGLKRNNLGAGDLMINQVPVIPPQFRPFSVTGSTFLPGNANEGYRDLMEMIRLHDRSAKEFGQEGANDVYKDVQAAARFLYGYGESPNPKTRSRTVKGFFETVTGTNPKTSFYQSRMLSKPVDTVGRGVVVPDADMDMNEIGLPEEMAWKLYANYAQRALVRGGMSPAGALKHVMDRTPQARKALETEMPNRPVVLTRSPAWHRQNAVGQIPRIVDGDAVRVNTFITEGQNMDFDGDTGAIHVPSSAEAVRDVRERLMPDKMVWSIKNRHQTLANPKHEQIIGLSMARDPGGRSHKFATEDEAHAAIEAGHVDLNDDIEIG